MGKISKFANLYDTNGNKIRSIDEKKGVLTDVTIEELEQMIDNYPKNGDKEALDRLKMYLFNMYNTYGNSHEQELIERIKAEAQKKTSEQEVKQALEDVAATMVQRTETNTENVERIESAGFNEYVDSDNADGQGVVRPSTIMDEYVDFEEVKEAA